MKLPAVEDLEINKLRESTILEDSELSKAKEENDTNKLDQDEISAVFVNQAHKEFKQLAYGLADRKKRAVARVLEAVLFEPLEAVELIGQPEKELFELCQKVMYHKGVVLNYAFKRMEELKKGELNEQEE